MTLEEAIDRIEKHAEGEDNEDIRTGLYSALYWLRKVDGKEEYHDAG